MPDPKSKWVYKAENCQEEAVTPLIGRQVKGYRSLGRLMLRRKMCHIFPEGDDKVHTWYMDGV